MLFRSGEGLRGAGQRFVFGEDIQIKGTQMTVKKGYFNNPMTFDITGWTPRYGLSLDFLISIHLGTMAPDLVHAMLQNFDIEVQVYLQDSGKGKVEASYLDPRWNNY